jgi:ABC-type protease/lipase transport system fused ATPase/permease subunit
MVLLSTIPDDLAIHEAAKAANIHSFVIYLPKGYDENVGEKGGQMSGNEYLSQGP